MRPSEKAAWILASYGGVNQSGWSMRVLLLLLPFLRGGLLLLLFLVREMMADDAAGRGAQQRVMVHHVARYAAHDRALDAAFGFGAGVSHERQQAGGRQNGNRFHHLFPY